MKASTSALCAVALSVAASVALPAQAASDEDLAAIRQEMKALRNDYEKKIRDLERRLKKTEGRKGAPEAAASREAQQAVVPLAAQTPLIVGSAPPPPPPAPVTPRAPTSANLFNPAISVILNGSYAVLDDDPGAARVPGFVLGEEGGLIGRGFSLGESELAISANVDQWFFAQLIAALTSEGEVEVEEAYIQTTNLPGGFTVKGGRIFSGIGYLNEKHAHIWDFADAPLPYRVMLENQYGDDGIQVRWLAPTDFFLEFGAEWFRGDSFPAGGADDNGAGTIAGYVHVGDDIDEESSFLAGLSYLRSKAVDRETDGGDLFTGTDDLLVGSLVYKWAPNGNPRETNLVVNGEYFFGREVGAFNGIPVDYDRSGFYVQSVYQFMPRWRFGVRYAELQTEAPPLPLVGSTLDDMGRSPQAVSALLEYRTGEFARFRAQYTLDDADLDTNHEFVFTYTVAIGAHGAHRF